MSLRSLARNSDNPYLACKYNFSDIAGYRDCFNCPVADSCDILGLRNTQKSLDDYYQNLRSQSLENKATYYQDENGWWHDDENFHKVKKDSWLKGISPRFNCWHGYAEHPDFWKCDKCAEISDCELGKFRLKRIAEQKRQKKLKAERDLKKISAALKKPFEFVADVFDKIFR